MRSRPFGATGLATSEIGVGCAGIGGVFTRGVTRAEQIRMIERAFDAGIRFFDTSDLYAQGQSEVLLGRALARHRGEVVIATKGGYVLPGRRRLLSYAKPVLRPVVQALGLRRRPTNVLSGAALMQDFSPAHLVAAVEASLRRLRTDHIDVYQLHSPPVSVLVHDDVFETLTDLRTQGKIAHFGVAADGVEAGLVEAIERGAESLQVPCSLLDQTGLDTVVPYATRAGAGVIARGCYAAGLLNESLTVEQLRQASPDWQAIVELREQARRLGRPLLDVALQFNLAQPGIAVTILGMRSLEHLEQNLHRYGSPPLTSEEVRLLRRDAASS